MADITNYQQGNVSEDDLCNWRGDQVSLSQGGQSIYDSSSVKLAPLGSRKVVGDRVFRYAKCGSLDAVPGKLLQAPAFDANWSAVALATTRGAVVGAKSLWLYSSTATLTANQLAEGYLGFESGTAANSGYQYRIKSHGAVTATTTFEVKLYDAIKQVATGTDKVSLFPNMYNGVTVQTTGVGACPVGIAPLAVTTNDYFWLQTWGPCPALNSTTSVAAGAPVYAGGTGDVCGVVGTGTYASLMAQIGIGMVTGTNREKDFVYLTIAP